MVKKQDLKKKQLSVYLKGSEIKRQEERTRKPGHVPAPLNEPRAQFRDMGVGRNPTS